MATSLKVHDVLLYIFGLLAIIFNGLLLLSMYNYRKKIFGTRISYLVANLAFADCLNGLLLIILYQPIKKIAYEPSDVHDDRLILSLIDVAKCASFFTLFLMAAERLVILILPMDWSSLLTIPRTILSIILVWIVSISAGTALYLSDYNLCMTQFFIYLAIDLSALCFIATHIYILWALRRRQKRRKENTRDQDSSQRTSGVAESHIAQQKVTVVIIILLAVLIIASLPSFVCLPLFFINNTFDPTLAHKVNLEIYDKVFLYDEAFFYINFIANPIIYAWRLRIYRKAFCSLLGRSTTQ